MPTLWTEDQITLQTLISHMTDCGLCPVPLTDTQIRLRTVAGIGYRVTILEERRFIHIGTFLPLDETRSREEKLAFEHRCNAEIFLPAFCLDDDEDLTVSYVMPYQQGMIAEQFIAMVNRFCSLLEYIVQSFNENGIIDFSAPTASDGTSDPSQSSLSPPVGTLLN